jgi:hypothetical protein
MDREVMLIEEAIASFPALARVVGAAWMRDNPEWFAGSDRPWPVWYRQIDEDLAGLTAKIPEAKLISCYRPMLRDRDGFISAVYEIHGAAVLAAASEHVELHVPRGSETKVNFDVLAIIDGVRVHADCKARRDDFPTKPQFKDSEFGYSATRAVLDPHDAVALGLDAGSAQVPTPESTVIRGLLEEALRQLPEQGINMVLFGQVVGDREHLERALLRGATVVDFIVDTATKKFIGTEARQVGSVVFGDPKFERLSAVVWLRITQLFGPMQYHYSLYLNPAAAVPMPPAVVATLKREFARRGSTESTN